MTERNKDRVIAFVGMDLAKRSFHLHDADALTVLRSRHR
jgi:hypothetical protein